MSAGSGSVRHAERLVFCEVVLEQIGRLTPRMSQEIWRRVMTVWGDDVSWRRVQRALAALRDEGKVRNTEDGYLLTRARSA